MDLGFQHYQEELQDLTKKYGLPRGRIYAAYVDDVLVGCLAFHALDRAKCEFKRLYVRPDFRGKSIAKMLMKRALDDAQQLGYQAVCLDTLASLKGAVALYQRFGFQEIPAYYENPLSGVLYYKKEI